MIKNGIGYSPLSDRVYLGKQNTEKRMWVGNDKKDITNEFLSIAHEFFQENTIRGIDCTNGNTNIFINIKKDKKSIERVMKKLNEMLKEFDKVEAEDAAE